MTCSRQDKIAQIIAIGKRLGIRNYSPGYSGNISARCGSNIIITTSGSSSGFLSEKDFVEIDFNGVPLDSFKKPSSEKLLHLAFYKKRTDINCVIHVHPAGLSAFAAAGKDLMQPVMPENIFYFGGIPLAPYTLPSSRELAEKTSLFFADYDAVLMENHGVIIGSDSLEDAYQKLEIAEEYAKTIIFAQVLGGVKQLSDKDVQEIMELKLSS